MSSVIIISNASDTQATHFYNIKIIFCDHQQFHLHVPWFNWYFRHIIPGRAYYLPVYRYMHTYL